MGVTAVDDDITLLEMGGQLSNKGVDRITSLDKENDFAWLLQLFNKLLDGVSTLDIGAWQIERMLFRLRDGNEFKGID